MKKLSIAALLCALALPMAAQSAGYAQGYLDFAQRQRINSCIQACGRDGNCQGRCLAANQQPQQRIPVTDYSCVERRMNLGVGLARAMQECTE